MSKIASLLLPDSAQTLFARGLTLAGVGRIGHAAAVFQEWWDRLHAVECRDTWCRDTIHTCASALQSVEARTDLVDVLAKQVDSSVAAMFREALP